MPSATTTALSCRHLTRVLRNWMTPPAIGGVCAMACLRSRPWRSWGADGAPGA